MKQIVVMSDDIKELQGVGEEWLVSSKGTLLAVFFDGNISSETVDVGVTKV